MNYNKQRFNYKKHNKQWFLKSKFKNKQRLLSNLSNLSNSNYVVFLKFKKTIKLSTSNFVVFYLKNSNFYNKLKHYVHNFQQQLIRALRTKLFYSKQKFRINNRNYMLFLKKFHINEVLLRSKIIKKNKKKKFIKKLKRKYNLQLFNTYSKRNRIPNIYRTTIKNLNKNIKKFEQKVKINNNRNTKKKLRAKFVERARL
jgi:hypothetical protein